jgi:hypothetical protein
LLKKNTGTSEIIELIESIKYDIEQLEFAQKVVTYMKDNNPYESYFLGENWNQLEKCKSWEYNKSNQLVNFKQWLHKNLIKDIQLNYNKENLPNTVTFNRKKFNISYKRN